MTKFRDYDLRKSNFLKTCLKPNKKLLFDFKILKVIEGIFGNIISDIHILSITRSANTRPFPGNYEKIS